MTVEFKITGPGKYRTRGGLEAIVDCCDPGKALPWRGTIEGALCQCAWPDSGRCGNAEYFEDIVERLDEPAHTRCGPCTWGECYICNMVPAKPERQHVSDAAKHAFSIDDVNYSAIDEDTIEEIEEYIKVRDLMIVTVAEWDERTQLFDYQHERVKVADEALEQAQDELEAKERRISELEAELAALKVPRAFENFVHETIVAPLVAEMVADLLAKYRHSHIMTLAPDPDPRDHRFGHGS